MAHMTYCVEVRGNAYKTNIDPIIKVQKRDIRMISKARYCESTDQLYLESCALKFFEIAYLKTMELTF